MGHLDFEVVPPQHKRFRLSIFTLLQVICAHVDNLLLKFCHEDRVYPFLQIEKVVSEHKGKLASAVLLVEQVNKVFELEVCKILLNVLEASMMVDHDDKFVGFAH